jgi:hypothetical protein
MTRHYASNSSRGAITKRNVRNSSQPRANKPRLGSYEALLSQFRERVLLLEILQCRRASPSSGLASKGSNDRRNPTLSTFLNELSWLCDHAPGGDSASSVVVEATAHGPKYWLSANFDPGMKMQAQLEFVLDRLAKLKTLPVEMNGSVSDEILQASLEFSKEKFECYKSFLTTAIYFAGESKTRPEDSLGKLPHRNHLTCLLGETGLPLRKKRNRIAWKDCHAFRPKVPIGVFGRCIQACDGHCASQGASEAS